MQYRSTFKILVLCQMSNSHSFQGYSELTFPSLVGPPDSESYFPLHIWVCHPVKNVAPPHIEFSFPVVHHLFHSVTIAFRATRIVSTVGLDISVDRSFQSYQNSDNFKS